MVGADAVRLCFVGVDIVGGRGLVDALQVPEELLGRVMVSSSSRAAIDDAAQLNMDADGSISR